MKLDFEKAYDSVDHGFLDSMLENIGVSDYWRGWIRHCISSPLLSVLVNGSPTPQFGLEIGLRQGDPLSPFLFNIVVEGLSGLILKAVDKGLVQGEDFGGAEVNISHLQFADNTILFIKPKVDYLINVRRILWVFKLTSGLKINFHKFSVVRLSKKKVWDHDWAAMLRCQAGALPLSYLGLPLGSKPQSKNCW